MIDFLKLKKKRKGADFHTRLGYNYAAAAPAKRSRQACDHGGLEILDDTHVTYFFMPSEGGQAGARLSRSHDKHDASALSLIPFAAIRVSSPLKVISMSISSAVGATLSGGVGINTPSPLTFQRQCCSAHLLAFC